MHRAAESTLTQSTNATVKLAAGVREAFNQDGAVLLDVDQGLCLSLNVVGAKIWQMLKQDWTREQIIAALAREFGEVPRAQLQQDYIDFVRQLETNKLARFESESTRTEPGETAA
jgi:Coenzyme PQQ synthesis protein D (PqqD)